jgi:hypothetical protein
MDLETSVFSYFNHLMRLVAREDFIIHCRREISRSYRNNIIRLSDFKALRPSALQAVLIFLLLNSGFFHFFPRFEISGDFTSVIIEKSVHTYIYVPTGLQITGRS